MTVKELKEALAELSDDMIVILQADGEGNSYSPLAGVDGDNNVYVPDSTWSGELHYKKLTKELRKEGYGEEDVYEGDDGEDAVVLFPTN